MKLDHFDQTIHFEHAPPRRDRYDTATHGRAVVQALESQQQQQPAQQIAEDPAEQHELSGFGD